MLSGRRRRCRCLGRRPDGVALHDAPGSQRGAAFFGPDVLLLIAQHFIRASLLDAVTAEHGCTGGLGLKKAAGTSGAGSDPMALPFNLHVTEIRRTLRGRPHACVTIDAPMSRRVWHHRGSWDSAARRCAGDRTGVGLDRANRSVNRMDTGMKSLSALTPRSAVLDGTADFVVNLADLGALTEDEAREFLDSNVLTSGMELLLSQAFARMAGLGSASGIYKLSESMGGGKTQTEIVAGILARFPHLAHLLAFRDPLPKVAPDVVAAFTGRSTDKKVWVSVGEALGVDFTPDRAPSETEWRDALKDRSALILLDEMAFYLVHAASQGSKEDGTRAATLAGIALTNLFGAVRDYKECRRCVIVIADLQKDWEQGAEELARIMRANDTLGGTLQSVNNEMSKGAQTIAPVDNSKDELYAILRRRLFKRIDLTSKDIEAVADGYVAELKKASAIIDRPTMKVREEILVSYPFHFSTKHLIGSFNDNPGFQKTRDVIRLMAAIVRSLWDKDTRGEAAVAKQYLLSLETADLNDSLVASRFVEIKKSLQDAMQTDIANSGTSHAESLDGDPDGLATCCARWLFAASLSEVHPRGLTESELAEYLLAPGRSIQGLHEALKQLYDTCWYIEQTQSGRYRFNRRDRADSHDAPGQPFRGEDRAPGEVPQRRSLQGRARRRGDPARSQQISGLQSLRRGGQAQGLPAPAHPRRDLSLSAHRANDLGPDQGRRGLAWSSALDRAGHPGSDARNTHHGRRLARGCRTDPEAAVRRDHRRDHRIRPRQGPRHHHHHGHQAVASPERLCVPGPTGRGR